MYGTSRANRVDFYISRTGWPIAFELGGWVVTQPQMALNVSLVWGHCARAHVRTPHTIPRCHENGRANSGSKVGGGVTTYLSVLTNCNAILTLKRYQSAATRARLSYIMCMCLYIIGINKHLCVPYFCAILCFVFRFQ